MKFLCAKSKKGNGEWGLESSNNVIIMLDMQKQTQNNLLCLCH